MSTTDVNACGELIRFAIGPSSLGKVLVASSNTGVVCILIGDQLESLVEDLRTRFPGANVVPAAGDYQHLMDRVIDHVENPATPFDAPLDIRGTPFQRQVWSALQAIPAGKTVTYSDIAFDLGAPKAVRAVAGACAANKIAIVIPCHRVVRNDGSLSGYRWGVARKEALIQREATSDRRTA